MHVIPFFVFFTPPTFAFACALRTRSFGAVQDWEAQMIEVNYEEVSTKQSIFVPLFNVHHTAELSAALQSSSKKTWVEVHVLRGC